MPVDEGERALHAAHPLFRAEKFCRTLHEFLPHAAAPAPARGAPPAVDPTPGGAPPGPAPSTRGPHRAPTLPLPDEAAPASHGLRADRIGLAPATGLHPQAPARPTWSASPGWNAAPGLAALASMEDRTGATTRGWRGAQRGGDARRYRPPQQWSACPTPRSFWADARRPGEGRRASAEQEERHMQQLEADKRAADAAASAGRRGRPRGRPAVSRRAESEPEPGGPHNRLRPRFRGLRDGLSDGRPGNSIRVRHGRGHARRAPRTLDSGRVGPDRRGGAAGGARRGGGRVQRAERPGRCGARAEARAARASAAGASGRTPSTTDSAGVPARVPRFEGRLRVVSPRVRRQVRAFGRAHGGPGARVPRRSSALPRGCRRPRVAVLHGRGPSARGEARRGLGRAHRARRARGAEHARGTETGAGYRVRVARWNGRRRPEASFDRNDRRGVTEVRAPPTTGRRRTCTSGAHALKVSDIYLVVCLQCTGSASGSNARSVLSECNSTSLCRPGRRRASSFARGAKLDLRVGEENREGACKHSGCHGTAVPRHRGSLQHPCIDRVWPRDVRKLVEQRNSLRSARMRRAWTRSRGRQSSR